MYWNWNKVLGGMLRFGLMFLSFSFVVQNESLLNNSFLKQLPVGFILLLIIGIFILRHAYRTLKWYLACFKAKRYRTNVFIHFCLYLIVFSIALSIPVALGTTPLTHENTLQYGGNSNAVHPIIEQPTPVEQPTITEQPTESSSTSESVAPAVDASSFKTNPNSVDYTYILRGSRGHITYTVYGGLSDYLKGLPKEITYEAGGTPPTDTDFLMRDLNDENQKQFLDPLVDQIKSITPNQDDQARIAISLVQNIPYDMSSFKAGNIEGKYPYETLYTDTGVCSQKSELLAYLLRGLGYGVVIFRFDNHDAVGLKCPQQYSYKGTGYCFVESTTPTIITDGSSDYLISGNSDATTKLADIFKTLNICDGNSFDSVSEEYNDNMDYQNLDIKLKSYGNGQTLSQPAYDEWKSYHDRWQILVDKYGIKIASN
jgi:hypothetical protein